MSLEDHWALCKVLEFNKVIFFVTMVFGLEEVMDDTFPSDLRSRANEMQVAVSVSHVTDKF